MNLESTPPPPTVDNKEEEQEHVPHCRISYFDVGFGPTVDIIKNRKDLLATKVERRVSDKVLRYSVIDGTKIKEFFPQLWKLRKTFINGAEEAWGGPLVQLHDLANMNINIVGPGEEQGFHFDRNEVTGLLYLTTVPGGDLEFQNPVPVKSLIKGVRGRIMERESMENKILAREGIYVVLVGANKILHRVAPVEKGFERVTLAIGFGIPGKNYAEPERDDFLYTDKDVPDQKVFE